MLLSVAQTCYGKIIMAKLLYLEMLVITLFGKSGKFVVTGIVKFCKTTKKLLFSRCKYFLRFVHCNIIYH